VTVEEELAQLRAENQRLGAENQELRRQVAELQRLNGELMAELTKGRGDPSASGGFVRANRPKREGPKPARKKRASEHNRVRRRETPTQTILHAYDRCPDCDYRLSGQTVDRVRQVIELPEPRPVEVTEHRVIKRYCPVCECFKSPPLDLSGEVLGKGRMGVRLASLVSYLRITERLPIRLIQSYLETIHRLKISVGEIIYLLDQVREATKPAVENLRDEARRSKVLHADETGWREDGQNGYIWSFSTPGTLDGQDAGKGKARDAIRYYERDQSRGQPVVRRILGNQFKGHLVSDFYVGYNDYECKKQRCWSHLLRDLHDLKEAHQGEGHQGAEDLETVKWAQAVRALYDEAEAFVAGEPKPSQEEREKRYVSLVERVHALGLEHAQEKGHPTHTLCKRVLLHEDELFQFVLLEGLSANNNLAERSIRPLVVIRKISGGSRSDSGSKTTMALASLLETWRARGLNPFAECLKLLSQMPAPSPA
jgi:transposase